MGGGGCVQQLRVSVVNYARRTAAEAQAGWLAARLLRVWRRGPFSSPCAPGPSISALFTCRPPWNSPSVRALAARYENLLTSFQAGGTRTADSWVSGRPRSQKSIHVVCWRNGRTRPRGPPQSCHFKCNQYCFPHRPKRPPTATPPPPSPRPRTFQSMPRPEARTSAGATTKAEWKFSVPQ